MPEKIDLMGFDGFLLAKDSPHDPRPCKTQVCAPLEMDVVQRILGFRKRINPILNLLILSSVSPKGSFGTQSFWFADQSR